MCVDLLVQQAKAGVRAETMGCFVLLRSASVAPQHCLLLQDAWDRWAILVVGRHPASASQEPSPWPSI